LLHVFFPACAVEKDAAVRLLALLGEENAGSTGTCRATATNWEKPANPDKLPLSAGYAAVLGKRGGQSGTPWTSIS